MLPLLFIFGKFGGGCDGRGELAVVEIEPDEEELPLPLPVQEFSLFVWLSGRCGGDSCCDCWMPGEGNSSRGDAARFGTDAGETEEAAGAARTAGGGIDFPPIAGFPMTPFDLEPRDIASIVTVGGKCLEVDPVSPEDIFDLSDFGCDLAGCEAIDAHDVVFWEPIDAKARGKEFKELVNI